ncbi:hypothetical protein [Deinococcus cellulosilyticus]|uniref:Uncharacterized protein n=1 Tax=Deinococcus cellulosilyticus (strain DSM 18568 / NBRC 106333 / KACC 11606 / 5516J-15) TaxID=1223518 RepID=A0A511N8C5_DEIC1|nr:hypothetical protein [Deinococcus cellulosilyticus]GEM48726.1 hypothetical protein DC3_43610 [Deinococcus cellulosilyticus NBRC 106333 = KACC 11606]
MKSSTGIARSNRISITTSRQPLAVHPDPTIVVEFPALPSVEALKKIIPVTHRWAHVFAAADTAGQLGDLLGRLELLEAGDVRDTRRSQILHRLGRKVEARNLLGRYRNSILVHGWDMAFRVDEVSTKDTPHLLREFEDTLERLKRSDDFDGRNVTLEGLMRGHMACAVGKINLGDKEGAMQHFEKVRFYAGPLQDEHMELLVLTETARLHVNLGELQEAGKVYQQLARIAKPIKPRVYNVVSVMSVWVAYLTGMKFDSLPDWAHSQVSGMREFYAVETHAPLNVVEVVTHALQALTHLVEHHAMYFPFYGAVEEHQADRDELVRKVLEHQHKANSPDEIMDFFLRVCKALALALQGSDDALVEVEALESSTVVSTIPLLSCLRHMVMIQVHALLPKAQGTPSLRVALNGLRPGYMALSDYQQDVLLAWGERYLPYGLWVLSNSIKDMDVRLCELRKTIIYVTEEEAVFRGRKISRYPKTMLCREVVDVLQGFPLSKYDRDQALRHKKSLEKLKVSSIVFLPVLRRFAFKLRCTEFEREVLGI